MQQEIFPDVAGDAAQDTLGKAVARDGFEPSIYGL